MKEFMASVIHTIQFVNSDLISSEEKEGKAGKKGRNNQKIAIKIILGTIGEI